MAKRRKGIKLTDLPYPEQRAAAAAQLAGAGVSDLPMALSAPVRDSDFDYVPVPPSEAKKPKMNRWERQWQQQLELRKAAGEILWHEFGYVRVRLADGAWYKPDFLVLIQNYRTEYGNEYEMPDHRVPCGVTVELHEVKGHWREAARVRIKVAADRHPWATFVVVTKDEHGRWTQERLPRGEM